MKLTIITSCVGLLYGAFIISMEKHSPCTIKQCWQHGYYSKNQATVRFGDVHERTYPWCNVTFDRHDRHIEVWCVINSTTLLTTSAGAIFLLDKLQEQPDYHFCEAVSASRRMVKFDGMRVEVSRGYHVFEALESYASCCQGVLLQGTQAVHGVFCCIPATIHQEQHLYVFSVHPFMYLTDLGVYESDGPLCYALNSDGSVIVVLGKHGAVNVIEVVPHMQKYPLLRRHAMAKLHTCHFSFV